jgi:hypothetical protein
MAALPRRSPGGHHVILWIGVAALVVLCLVVAVLLSHELFAGFTIPGADLRLA